MIFISIYIVSFQVFFCYQEVEKINHFRYNSDSWPGLRATRGMEKTAFCEDWELALLAEILEWKILRYMQQYGSWWSGVECHRKAQQEWEMGKQMGVRAEGKAIKCFKIVMGESILLFQLSHVWWVELSCLFKAFLSWGDSSLGGERARVGTSHEETQPGAQSSSGATKLNSKQQRSVENMSIFYSQSCS